MIDVIQSTVNKNKSGAETLERTRLLKRKIEKSCPAFADSFEAEERYKVEWGGAGSGKSHAVARRLCYRLIAESVLTEQTIHTILVARKVNRTIKKSCFKLIRNVLIGWCRGDELPISISDFSINTTDLSITHKNTGAQIIFTGMDDEEKLKSIEGVTSIWIEEASELLQTDFEQLDLRLRGEHNCKKEIYLTFNPVSEQSWLKKVFFDSPIESVHTNHSTYLDNLHIDNEYKLVLENKKISNPRYFNIYALGQWGVAEGLVFERVSYRLIKPEDIKGLDLCQGLDFGYTNDPTAFNQTYIDIGGKKLYVYDGFYEKGMSNSDIAERLKSLKAHRHQTTCDSAEPKSIDSLKNKGCKVRGAQKGKDSINAGIDFLLEFEIIVNAHLVEFKTEFENYSWKKSKEGDKTNTPVDDFNHFIDSLRYGVEHHYTKRKTNWAAIAEDD